MEPLERIHQRVQGAGADSPVQGDGEAGGVSAVRPTSVIPIGNVGVRSRSCAAGLSRLEKMGERRDRTPLHIRGADLSVIQVSCSHQDVQLLAIKTNHPWENEFPTG